MKFTLLQVVKVRRGSRDIASTLSLTLAVNGGGWLKSRPRSLYPRERDKKLCGSKDRSERM